MFPDNKELTKDYPLQSVVFGHRLRPDQTVYEYIIEFLQVMISKKSISSTDYEEYFPIDKNVYSKKIEFYPISRIGLKRFIFFKKSKQDGKFPIDIGAYERCREILEDEDKLDVSSKHDFIDEEYTINMLENLLYGFRAVVKNRSWFAQSTLPVCEELILPETMGDKKSRIGLGKFDDCLELNPEYVDGLFQTNRYNFMSRGGEVYYLHLLRALNNNDEYKDDIEDGFRKLINKFPKLSLISNFITESWESESGCSSTDKKIKKTLGTIPNGFERREKYTLIELKNFLSTNIHPFEKIDILSYGILLQMLRMLHEQACATCGKSVPFWVIDVREGNKSDSEVKKLAIKSYTQFEQDILEALYKHLNEYIKGDEAKTMSSAIKDTYKLYRKLGKEIGVVIPPTGPGMRFSLSENMVKFLVLSIVKPNGKLTLDTFLDKLYEHYGIVIDSKHYEIEMDKSQKFYLEDLSMLYKNKIAFQQMLKDCGFLRDLSDSTSIVENPYDRG